MKQAWVKQREKERIDEIKKLKADIRKKLFDSGDYNESEIELFIKRIDKSIDLRMHDQMSVLPYDNQEMMNRWKSDLKLWKRTIDLAKTFPYDRLVYLSNCNYERYLDSEPTHFYGDIIITDPCYILKDEDREMAWDEGLESVIPGSIERSTIYGDWSCTTFDAKTKEPIGNFCADGGMVCVCDLNEVLKVNPDYNDHVDYPHAVTVIKDFDGKVWFEVKHNTRWNDFYVHVRGKGKNIKTGVPIEFITKQTGL